MSSLWPGSDHRDRPGRLESTLDFAGRHSFLLCSPNYSRGSTMAGAYYDRGPNIISGGRGGLEETK